MSAMRLVEYFDRDENTVRTYNMHTALTLLTIISLNKTGSLVANLSDGPQKINGLAGVTLGTFVLRYHYSAIV